MGLNDDYVVSPTLVFDEVHARKKSKSQKASAIAIKNVSFYVAQGEAVGLIARNVDGAGVILEAISGSIQVERGQVLIRRRIAWLTSVTEFSPDEQLGEALSVAAMYLALSGSSLKSKVADVLASLDLVDSAHQLVDDVDPLDVERARLRIAIEANPAMVIIGDKAARSVAITEEAGRALIGDYLERGGSVLIVDETPRAMRRICLRMIWLRDGEVIMDGQRIEVGREFSRSVGFASDKTKLAQLFRRYRRQYRGVRLDLERL